jgi:hypothetical protein
MAYMSQEKKSKIAPTVKKILAKYGVKGSLAVQNHMTLVLNVKSGPIDFIQNYNETVGNQPGGFRLGSPATDSLSVNNYWYHEHFSGKAKSFLTEIMVAMNDGNHDRSDIQSDYHDVGWYVDVNIGKWNKPYILSK